MPPTPPAAPATSAAAVAPLPAAAATFAPFVAPPNIEPTPFNAAILAVKFGNIVFIIHVPAILILLNAPPTTLVTAPHILVNIVDCLSLSPINIRDIKGLWNILATNPVNPPHIFVKKALAPIFWNIKPIVALINLNGPIAKYQTNEPNAFIGFNKPINDVPIAVSPKLRCPAPITNADIPIKILPVNELPIAVNISLPLLYIWLPTPCIPFKVSSCATICCNSAFDTPNAFAVAFLWYGSILLYSCIPPTASNPAFNEPAISPLYANSLALFKLISLPNKTDASISSSTELW